MKLQYMRYETFRKSSYSHRCSLGTCMELAGSGTLNQYSCSNFINGCPDKAYLSYEVYQCKIFFSGLSFCHFFFYKNKNPLVKGLFAVQ